MVSICIELWLVNGLHVCSRMQHHLPSRCRAVSVLDAGTSLGALAPAGELVAEATALEDVVAGPARAVGQSLLSV